MLKDSDKVSVIKRIEFIRIELEDLKEYKNLTFQEYNSNRIARRNVERIIENVANALIDISKILIANENVDMPDSYRDIILKLGEVKIIELDLARSISEIARLRNVLAHQYLDIKWSYIKNFLEEKVDDVYTFLNIIDSYIR
ncbi:type VII toxin-antitoxin system HepT family RNase toxin [Caldanaerobacter subterraneus]|uniref:type VII toxin-antitoxin system HepT family RNase toxin n=1 Tax=Caldanaerobacter subterraneus TaxID=911092 RepID=UPI0034639525